MRISIAEITLASPEMTTVRDFFAGVLGASADLEDHDYFYKLRDVGNEGCIAVVPHNGDPKWDRPWITLSTDDMPAALKHLRALGVTDIENSGPTDDDGNPIACVTFRDPEDRLIMLATSEMP